MVLPVYHNKGAAGMKEKASLRFEEIKLLAADLGQEASIPDLTGEVIQQNKLEFQLDEDDEIYQGYGRVKSAYPYRQRNSYSEELKERIFRAAVLENKNLRAVFLPELGGRLWSLLDKKTGRNLLYTNDVVQFRNLSVRNAWFSGGVEWNIGIIGHTPFTTEQMYTAKLKDASGNPVLRMYEYERIRKVFYQMDFWLAPEDTVLNCRMRIVNENDEVVPMYWWSNMAVPEFEGGRIIVPARKAYTFEEGKVTKVSIPMVNGVDVTHYEEIPRSVDYFFDLVENSPKYIANVDNSGYGLLQMSTARLKSRKLFSWGHKEGSIHWQEYLTKDAGRYVEIQAGLGKTQYGCIPMAPHTAWEWLEQYGALQVDTAWLDRSHEENWKELSEKLKSQNKTEQLEKLLKETKILAKTPAELVYKGSGYGALAVTGHSVSHLKFVLDDPSLKRWKEFMETGILGMQDPYVRPDLFTCTEEVYGRLRETINGLNKENWYAHYHLGVRFFEKKKCKKAKKELKKAYQLAANPWSCHALACVYLALDKKKKSASWISKGISMNMNDVSYLKEGFKLLTLGGKYKKLIKCYEALGEQQQQISRIKFYYINTLYKEKHSRKAFELLTENGGLSMEDIREGEFAIEKLWDELCLELYGQKRKAPHKFIFDSL